MKSPWYPRYPQDLIGSIDCRTMSLEEYGLFNWLLDYSWANESFPCHLEYSPAGIARLVGVPLKKFVTVWAGIQKKFLLHIDPETKKEYIYNARLLKEYQKRMEVSDRQTVKGVLSGEARRAAARTKTEPNAEPNVNQNRTTVQPNGEPNGQPEANPERTPSQSQSHNTNMAKRPSPRFTREYTPEFDGFWGISSKRGNKFEAFEVWLKIPESLRLEARSAMEFAVSNTWRYTEPKYIPHVSSWLNSRGWEQSRPPDPPPMRAFKAVV